jgi:hypothetical protein
LDALRGTGRSPGEPDIDRLGTIRRVGAVFQQHNFCYVWMIFEDANEFSPAVTSKTHNTHPHIIHD